jgi:hypothetical protein
VCHDQLDMIRVALAALVILLARPLPKAFAGA